jgi:ABC-type sugar transport system permease subunit
LVSGSLYAVWNQVRRRARRVGPRTASPHNRKLPFKYALLFVGPTIGLFLFFVLLPALQSFSWCVQKWDGLTDAQFVGLRNFRYLLFSSDGFWTALGNNLFIMFVIPLLMVPLSLFLAACVSRGVRGANFLRGAFLLPSVIGGVSATLLWMQLYDPQAGIVNAGLVAIGKGFSHAGMAGIGAWFKGFDGFAWLSQAHLYTALLPMSVWAGFGFNFVLYLAAMEAVPGELYEAAELDGASPVHQFFTVTLPLIWEVLTISAIFMVIGGMKAFESIWLLTNQQPSSAVHVIGTKMMQSLINEMNVGQATAIAVLLFAMVFVGSAVAMRLMQRETVEL